MIRGMKEIGPDRPGAPAIASSITSGATEVQGHRWFFLDGFYGWFVVFIGLLACGLWKFMDGLWFSRRFLDGL